MANQRTRRGKNRRTPTSKPARAAAAPRPRQPPAPWTGRRITLAALKWSAIGGLAAMAVAFATLALIFWVYGRDPNLPNIRTLADYEPVQVTRIAAADGTVVGELYTERRRYVAFEEIPQVVVHAFIAAEDADFFRHEGLDYWGMLRAVIVNLREGKKKQGASTITQQVVKTFLLTRDKTFKRKFQEIILARRLESALSKDEILALYLNQIYFGHGRYGIREAAQYYFGKEVKDLNAGEAALIAGLPKGPELLSPKKPRNRERAKSRQKYVLEQMVHHRYLDEAEAKKWIDAPIAVVRDPFPEIGTAPEFIDVARQQLVDRHGEDEIDKLGIDVITTLDRDIQRAAVRALENGLQAIDARRKYGRPLRQIKPDKIDLEVAKLARKLPRGGPKRGESYLAVVRAVHGKDRELVVDLGDWQASVVLGGDEDDRYNPPDPKTGERKKPGERFAVGDLIRVDVPAVGQFADDESSGAKHSRRQVALSKGPQGAVVVLDPRTREVLALVGGYDFNRGDFDRALRAERQAGSTFKPIVYAAAIDSGQYTAASIVNDAPEVYDLWKPQNYNKGEFEGKVRLRYALAKSINTVAIRVLHDVGAARVVELAHELGIASKLPSELSLALGSGAVTPLELTNAFASLAAGGVHAPPRFLRETAGEKLPPDDTKEVLRPQVAYIVVDMMTSVVQEGTARRARKLDTPVAGKTGTSNDARDAWFIGITPRLVVGVWVGFDDNRPIGRGESGGKSALPVFVELMAAIDGKQRGVEFAMPEGVTRVLVDRATGLLAPPGADRETTYEEVFITGTEPTELAVGSDEAAADTFVQDEYEDETYGDDTESELYEDIYDELEEDGAGGNGTGDRRPDKRSKP